MSKFFLFGTLFIVMRSFSPIGLVLLLQCFSGLSCAAQGFDSGYFHQNDYPGSNSLTFTPLSAPLTEQWYTDDPFVPTNNPSTNGGVEKGTGDTSLASFVVNYTPGVKTNSYHSVVFGTYAWSDRQYYDFLPGRTNPTLFKWFPSAAINTNRSVTFLAEFSLIRNADVAWPVKDTFGFELFSKATNNGSTNLTSLARFNFNPNAPILTNSSTYLFEWHRSGVKQAPANPGLTGQWPLTYGTIYRITTTITGSAFDLVLNALSSPTGTNVFTMKLIDNGQLASGFTAADFNTLAVNWRLTSTNPLSPGSKNYILFNRLAVLPMPTAIENWLTAAGWPASTPLTTTTNGQTFSPLVQYALGASAPDAAFEKPTVQQNVVEGAPVLEFISVVRTNDPNVTVVGESVSGINDFATQGAITAVPGVISGVNQSGVPAGSERQAFRVPINGAAQRFLRLRVGTSE